MNFTKSQVIAIFLASSQAVTVDQLINGNCSADTVAAATPTNSLTVCSSLTVCTDDAGCTGTANEKCGTQKVTGVAVDVMKCVYQRACDNVGKVESAKFSITCVNGVVQTAEQLTAGLPATVFDAVATIVGQDGLTSFDAITNVKIPSKSNFQTGWWTEAAGVFTETDKPVNNKCVANGDCTDGQCCANWPDTNNKRCITKTLGGVEQTLLPFAAFTPVCAASGNAPPISAKDDLADEAAAQAAQELSNWETLMKTTLQTEEKYEDLTVEKKAEWDTKYAAEKVKVDEKLVIDKTNSGFAGMTTEQKTIYDAELLKWMKATFEACSANKESIECRKQDTLRLDITQKRKTDGYYSKNTEERAALDIAQADAAKTQKAVLKAAWIKENKPAAGKAGSSCSAAEKCTGADFCCGTATPKTNAAGVTTGERTGMCVSKTTKSYKDDLGEEFTHVCGAQKLVAAAGALLAAAYLM